MFHVKDRVLSAGFICGVLVSAHVKTLKFFCVGDCRQECANGGRCHKSSGMSVFPTPLAIFYSRLIHDLMGVLINNRGVRIMPNLHH